MKRIRRALIPLILLMCVFTTSVFAAPTQSQLEKQKKQAEKEMKSLQAELTDIMTEINVTEQKLVATGEAIIDATERLEEAEKNEKIQHDNMMRRIVAMYESGNSSMLQMIMESGSIADMLQRVENVQAVHEYDRKALDEYIAVKEEIAKLKTSLEKDQAALVKLEANLSQKQNTLNKKIAAKKKEVDSIQANIDAAIAEAARLAAEEAKKKEENKQQVIVGGYTGTGDQSVGDAIVAAARTQLGVTYVWGGTTPYKGLDCSGLTQYCHKVVGISIPRVSYDQRRAGKEVWSPNEKTTESYGVSLAKPGDVICYSGHVAIYIGNSKVIHAPQTGDVVKISTVYMKTILSIRRYW